ncbi:hypothetical protein DH2020_035510 [Rehmannia glutinosa]|uniref:Kinesin motor domain-containing protein n=1 Tax=Rehmannia glutinosa TaxID=99300 RepID=A0ABR0V9N6_REHGL
MENCESSQSVRVAVNIRPLVTPELLVGCTDCITVYPAQKQVQIGSHAFTFDNIFGSKGCPSSSIFDECVAPLVDALFHGYNGTVLAYGQTGSGKTYTMGTNYNGEEHRSAVIPKVMDTIFSKAETLKESTEFLIRVSFIEIFKEEVFDLLDPKTTGPARVPIQIRERVNGGITLAGVTEAEVRTKEEMASFLLQGSLCRATGSTNMNSQSSRSHAIFTISMEQRTITHSSAGDDVGDDVLIAKLHLVDLAGSERKANRCRWDTLTGSLVLFPPPKTCIHINKGLLALGNVISALGDDKKRKEGGHVPYRDSKLTRILQARMSSHLLSRCLLMRRQDPFTMMNCHSLQLCISLSHVELDACRVTLSPGDSNAPAEEIKVQQCPPVLCLILKHKISLLEASKMELQEALQECRISYEHLTQRAIDAQVERDRLMMQIELVQNGKPLNGFDTKSDKDFDMVKSYITKIQELESELIRIRNSSRLRHENSVDYLDSEDDGNHSKNLYLMDPDLNTIETEGVVEDVEKELEHSTLQEKLDMELKELDKRLEEKEHYERKVQDLELEKRALQKEIEELRHNLANISSNSDDSAHKLKEEYLQKLNLLESQVAVLKKKQDAQAQLLRQKQKSDEAAKRLQDEIHRIKTQKVQLQQKIKQESEQFRQWKASREKEVLQLKKEGRRNEYEMHKLLALNQRQKLVLQRKTEEAAMATKRLKELLDSRKASRETPGAGSSKGPGIQALVQTIEHELEVTVGVHEVRRAKMAEEVARLKEEALIERQQNLSTKSTFSIVVNSRKTMSPGARNSRVHALENMLATSSSALVSMASQLSEAEERERAFSGRGRCQLRDREVDCREKDSEIRDLKEKVVNLKLALERQSSDGHAYDLRSKGSRKSTILNSGVYVSELLEDMDTSDDDQLEDSNPANDEDTEWELTIERKRRQAKKRNSEKVCCTCSKSSSCKTSRCECRAASGNCSLSCSCEPTRCSNREEITTNETAGNMFETHETDRNDLASHGAMLLQTALSEKPVSTNDGGSIRKPLSDIGNNLAISGVPKPNNLRKKWRKSVIQLVPATPTPPVAQAQNVEVSEQPKANGETDIPLKLPRAMRSTLTNNNQLKERNSDQPNEHVSSDTNTSSSLEQARTKNGKENRGL